MKIEPYHNVREGPGSLPDRFVRWLSTLRQRLLTVPENFEGDGTPEGTVSAPAGSRYFNRTGAPGSYLYVKTTATGNTGWVAYG